MKLYLSSYRMGDQVNDLIDMLPLGCRIALIPNAVDYMLDPILRQKKIEESVKELQIVSEYIDIVDLQKYFGKKMELHSLLDTYDLIWVRGGNVFILRQAMMLSGMDDIVVNYWNNKKDIVYGGYSAGVCILGPHLNGLELLDSSSMNPYHIELMTSGLGILEYCIAPHYLSDHPETERISDLVNWYIKNKVLFICLRDGEVIIVG